MTGMLIILQLIFFVVKVWCEFLSDSIFIVYSADKEIPMQLICRKYKLRPCATQKKNNIYK